MRSATERVLARVALESGQPIGHLCDLLGISRFRPGVFDEMVDLLGEGNGEEAQRDSRLAALQARLTRR